MSRLGSYIRGDEVLVSAAQIRLYDANYNGADQWLRVTGIAPGTASVYPIKVEMPNGAPGQLKEAEVLGHRRPDGFRRALDEHVRHMDQSEIERIRREK